MDNPLLQHLTEFRKELHANPELSSEETKTAARVKDFLADTGAEEIRSVGKTGLAIFYEGSDEGPTVLLRSELDALPIAEINDFPHRSTVENVSHKCGHDGHAAIIAGVGKRVSAEPIRKGRLVLLFQPAEETGKGARMVLDDPEFKSIRPDYVFALHNLPGFPTGAVVTRQGTFTAAVCTLVIFLKGKTAHAAEPENGINPMYTITEIVQKCQELEQKDPGNEKFTLITPTYCRVGELAYGTAAGDGEIHLTIRAWESTHLQLVVKKLIDWALVFGLKTGLKIETEIREQFHANVNDAMATALVEEAANDNGLQIGSTPYPFRWGEDFGLFTSTFKGAMFGLGAGNESPALHNPDYDFPDELLPTGVAMMETLVRKLLG